jgi:hypothetical protein
MNAKMIDTELDYIRLSIVDRIISKTANVSEITQIGRSEKRIRSFFLKTWSDRVKKNYTIIKNIKSVSTIIKKINKNMNSWKHDVSKVFSLELSNVYKLARIAGYKKATEQTKEPLRYGLPKQNIKKAKVVLPEFDLVDEKTVESIIQHQTFWVGEVYNEKMSDEIARTVRETMVESGLGPDEASKLLRENLEKIFETIILPTGFVGTPESYFSGLAANSYTVARIHGQMRSFSEIGITSYEISNPGDKRTCSRCAHFDGKVFRTENGVEQIVKELSLKDPKKIKEVHPWPSLSEIKKISSKGGFISGSDGLRDSEKLAKAGLSLPPYHFKCRCTVDISTESSTFENLQPLSMPLLNKKSKS